MTPVLLLILDGWGYREDPKYNAIAAANPTHFNTLWNYYPHTLLPASGESVGLPEGIIGTSEIGHMIIGSGTIIYTDLLRINKAIEIGSLGSNEVLQNLFTQTKSHTSTLHLIGLVSPGGVHSHQEHLFALLREVKKAEVPRVAIHVIGDGRDTPPKSLLTYLKQLEGVLAEVKNAHIATITGRYYAMDRDTNWDRTEKEVAVLFNGTGEVYQNKTPEQVVEDQYMKGLTDEFLLSSVLLDEHGQATTIKEHDAVLFYNFRPDRARQLTAKIAEKVEPLQLSFATMTQYDKSFTVPVVFPPEVIATTIADEVAQVGLHQVHIAETEKYAHVTYFLNGGNEEKHQNEEFILIESRKDVPTHDKAPEMKAKEIADAAIEKINQGVDFLAVNFANADMVGHTGIMEAAIKAVQAEDEQIGRLAEAISQKNGVLILTADHGNAEMMFDDTTGQPYTAHTLDPIPFIITMKDIKLRDNGTMADIAPTVLKVLGLDKPSGMTGESLY